MIVAFAIVCPAAISLLGACGARTGAEQDLSSTPSGRTTDAAVSTSTPSTGDVPTRYESPQQACLTSSASTHAYSSEADLQSLLIGRWMLCNPGTPNGYWSAEGLGLDLLASGIVYPLFRGNNGQIMRGGGEYLSRYSVVPGQGTAFDLVFQGGGDPTFHSVLTDDPRKLVMDDGQRYTFAPAQ